MGVDATIITLYKIFLDSDELIDTIVGVYEISHIIKYGRDSNDVKYNLIMDCETRELIEFLCYSWASKIRATVFKRAIEEWVATQQIPYHIIPKKDFTEYVGENDFLQCPEGFDV